MGPDRPHMPLPTEGNAVPYKVLEQMTKHPLTDQGIAKFQADYKAVFGE